MLIKSFTLLAGCLLAFQSHAMNFDEWVQRAERTRAEAATLTAANCQASLERLAAQVDNWMPEAGETESIQRHGPAALKTAFQARLALRARLRDLPAACAAPMRVAFRALREGEDMIGLVAYGDRQVRAEDIKFNEQPVPLVETASYRPYQLNVPAFEFRQGDIMITKGVSAISSTISAIPQQASLFSHIVFVYQDEKESGTIESYIGKGVSLYPMKAALQNENARILVLRSTDQPLARHAHDYMLNRVRTLAAEGRHISYDYALDFSNNDTLSCEEVAYDAYNTASSGRVKLPWSESVVSVRDERFVQNAGLKNGPQMMPADMEVDPRFEVVLDWTDFRLVRDSWRKDAVFREIFRWMNEERYVMNNTFKATMGQLLWKTRASTLFWPLFSNMTGIPKDFEKEVPGAGLATIANITTLAEYLVPQVAEADRAQFDATGRWMSPAELRRTANAVRVADRELYAVGGPSHFHYFFRPNTP
ncbi:MAG: hypothetical protein ABW190_09385 [Rhizobacter sp.]